MSDLGKQVEQVQQQLAAQTPESVARLKLIREHLRREFHDCLRQMEQSVDELKGPPEPSATE